MSGVRCYRVSSSSEDPERVLTDAGQWTEPWGEGRSREGEACDKCRGEGEVTHECWSCLLAGLHEACPACAGAVRWKASCPVCRGSGRIDSAPRHGVSVFPTLEGLYHYMLAKDANLDDCMTLELEATRAPDVDFDADQGALLAIPTEIIACHRVDRALVERVQARGRTLADR